MQSGSNDESGYGGSGDSGQVVTEQIRQGTQQVIDQTSQAAGQIKDQVTDQAQSFLESRKGQAAGSINELAHAIRQTGDSLHQHNNPLAGMADGVAQRIEGLGRYLEQRNVQQLVGEAERWARRSPALFLGGAFVLGVAAARFLKSSVPQSTDAGYGASYTRYGSGYGGDTGGYNRFGSHSSPFTDYAPAEYGAGQVTHGDTDGVNAPAGATSGTYSAGMETLGFTEGSSVPEETDGESSASY